MWEKHNGDERECMRNKERWKTEKEDGNTKSGVWEQVGGMEAPQIRGGMHEEGENQLTLNWRVGGSQGKTAQEEEDVKMKVCERGGRETTRWSCQGEREREREPRAKQINNQLTGITTWMTQDLPEPEWRGRDSSHINLNTVQHVLQGCCHCSLKLCLVFCWSASFQNDQRRLMGPEHGPEHEDCTAESWAAPTPKCFDCNNCAIAFWLAC